MLDTHNQKEKKQEIIATLPDDSPIKSQMNYFSPSWTQQFRINTFNTR